MTARIQDYGAIGDGRSVALVSRDGSVDWLCWPRFDSPAIFGAILDRQAGSWRIGPAGEARVTRRYVGLTNVLETTFDTGTGTLVLTDFMPALDESEKRARLTPASEFVRLAQCTSGEVDVELAFAPRPGFGLERIRMRDAKAQGIKVETKRGLVVLRAAVPLELQGDVARASVRLRAGEHFDCSLTCADLSMAVLPPLGARSWDLLARTLGWWERWAATIAYDGPERAAVLRSALALRLLVYAPSGAMIAAATTSLPERIGGGLNWDYRFCWLRDASLTSRALVALDCWSEAQTFLAWLLHSTRLGYRFGSGDPLRILYDVYGRRAPAEHVLPLAGHRGSRPVRIGNAAEHQRQLDVYGEVIDAAAHVAEHDGAFDRDSQRMLIGCADWVRDHWRTADEGIWEPRSGRAHHTHSRLLCWVALDRLIGLAARGVVDARCRGYRAARDAIRRDLEARAWNPRIQSYVGTLGGDDVDASVLRLAWYGFERADSPRLRATWRCVRERLGAPGGQLYRYRGGDSEGEGAFGICGFWASEFLALGGGSHAEAAALFHEQCGAANDLGLFAEELDPVTGDALGNFPQAFTHLGLVNAGLTLAERARADRRGHRCTIHRGRQALSEATP